MDAGGKSTIENARRLIGECVLFTQGCSARLTPATKEAPVDAVIVGIVDTVEVEGEQNLLALVGNLKRPT